MSRPRLYLSIAVSLILSACGAKESGESSKANGAPQSDKLAISADDIGGVVTGPKGPEAGVWVIAETGDLPTPFRKIVVTDDAGQFLLPELPEAKYKVWVRGYGLLDSTQVQAARGDKLALTALAAPDAKSAAQVYPPNYWASLLHYPPKSAFPRKDDTPRVVTELHMEASISTQAQSQTEFVYQNRVCFACHQVGSKATRELHPDLGEFASTEKAWEHRVNIGQYGQYMSHSFELFPPQIRYSMYADWTDRIAAGEAPPAPPRPEGVERNVVLTIWDWGPGVEDWVHDTITTDKRNPTLYGDGLIYGASVGGGGLTVLNPKTNEVSFMKIPTREFSAAEMEKDSLVDSGTDWKPSPYWKDEKTWKVSNHPHNVMFDQKGLLWATTRIRPVEATPAYCKAGSDNPYAKNFPLPKSDRQAGYYDTKTKEWTLVDTCFSTHHLQFAEDKNDTLWFSGDINVVGWVDTSVLRKTGDEKAAQGWCPSYFDTDGNGTYDPKKDDLLDTVAYGIQANPVDGSVWFASAGLPGKIVRMERGSNPPQTCRTEVYEPPYDSSKQPNKVGYSPKGLDIDRKGVIWTVLWSGHMASFDRSKCSVRSGPNATGQHCPEGWKLHKYPGPTLNGVANGESADFAYYNYVDQFNVFGLGENVPIAMGSNSDSVLILNPETGKWNVIRVPYPMGFFSRGIDGRIDDPKAGWKGRGLWANSSKVPEWHTEGKDTKPYLVHFQLRPNPLAN